MKQRHWHRIMEVTNYNFDLESEGFCLKNILEAPLLKYKEDIEVKYFISSRLDCCSFCHSMVDFFNFFLGGEEGGGVKRVMNDKEQSPVVKIHYVRLIQYLHP